MSDHFRIQIEVELYDMHKIANTQSGDLLVHILEQTVSNKLTELDFPTSGFFVSADGH